MIDCSIIIPAYNEEKFLPRTLTEINKSLKEISEFNWEIIVVDNNSTDSTSEVARNFGAKIIFEPINQIARARNTGARNSVGRYLFFIDADVIITPNLLKKSLMKLCSKKVCGGSTIIDPINHVTEEIGWGVVIWNFLSKIKCLATGQFVYCLREAYEGAGGFNKEVYAGEDILFSKSLKKWGRKHSMKFIILDVPLQTSSRKAIWYPKRRQRFWAIFRLILFPKFLKDKSKCDYYYKRPDFGRKIVK